MLVIKFLYLYIFFGLFVSFVFRCLVYFFKLLYSYFFFIVIYNISMGNYGICNYCIGSYGRLGCFAVAPSCGCLGFIMFLFCFCVFKK